MTKKSSSLPKNYDVRGHIYLERWQKRIREILEGRKKRGQNLDVGSLSGEQSLGPSFDKHQSWSETRLGWVIERPEEIEQGHGHERSLRLRLELKGQPCQDWKGWQCQKGTEKRLGPGRLAITDAAAALILYCLHGTIYYFPPRLAASQIYLKSVGYQIFF